MPTPTPILEAMEALRVEHAKQFDPVLEIDLARYPVPDYPGLVVFIDHSTGDQLQFLTVDLADNSTLVTVGKGSHLFHTFPDTSRRTITVIGRDTEGNEIGRQTYDLFD